MMGVPQDPLHKERARIKLEIDQEIIYLQGATAVVKGEPCASMCDFSSCKIIVAIRAVGTSQDNNGEKKGK